MGFRCPFQFKEHLLADVGFFSSGSIELVRHFDMCLLSFKNNRHVFYSMNKKDTFGLRFFCLLVWVRKKNRERRETKKKKKKKKWIRKKKKEKEKERKEESDWWEREGKFDLTRLVSPNIVCLFTKMPWKLNFHNLKTHKMCF